MGYRQAAALAAGFLVLVLLLAACADSEASSSESNPEATAAITATAGDEGSSSADPEATTADTPVADASEDSSSDDPASGATDFASCMRANGVPDFPDPLPNGGFRLSGDIAGNPNFQFAREACEHLIPEDGPTMGGNADPELILEFARCMRENGVPNFPDPGAGGTALGTSDLGIDTSSPAFQAAIEICREQTGIQIQMR